MIKQMRRFLRKDQQRMNKSSTHLVVLVIHNSKKHGHGSVCKNCVNEIAKCLDQKKLVKNKTRVAYPVSPDRRNNGLDVTPVAAAKHVWDDIIAGQPIDCITFKTSKTNACGIDPEGFVATPVENMFKQC